LERKILGYEILEVLGSNSISSTYKASSTYNKNEVVVIKMFRPNLSSFPQISLEMNRRSELISTTNHPGLVDVIYHGEENGKFCVVTEYCEYQSLETILDNMNSLSQIITILKNLSDTICFFNDMGIYHTNITPSKVFVNTITSEVKISGLAISEALRSSNDNTYIAINRPETPYIAPESLNNQPMSLSSNTYSIGVIAYRLITGELPYKSLDHSVSYSQKTSSAPKGPSTLNRTLPKEVDFIFNKVLSPHPRMRYENARLFMNDLIGLSLISNSGNIPSMANDNQTQKPIPGLENQITREYTVEYGTSIRCRICGYENSSGIEWCMGCRSILKRAGAGEDEEVATSEERSSIKETRDRIRRTLVGGISICFLAFSITQFLDITFPLPPPTSNISSISEPGEWAMIHRDHSGLHTIETEDLSISGNVKWAFETNAKIVSTPVLKGDMVYLNTQDHRIVALNRNSGAIIWERPTEIPVDSSPAVTDNLIFIGLRNNKVLALDRYNGDKKWQFVMPDNPDALPLEGSPIVKDGVLYIGSGDNKLYALDALTGELKWDYLTRDWLTNTPAISNNLLVIASMDGRVTIHDTNTGKRRFSFRGLGPHIMGSPNISGDSIYVTYRNGYVISVNLHEEEVLFFSRYYRLRLQLWLWGMMDHPGLPKGVNWIRPMGGTISSTTSSDGQRVYVSTQEGLLHALNDETGKREWLYDVRPLKISSSTIVKDTLLLTDATGKLHAVDKHNGEPLWQIDAANNISTIPVVADGVLYLASEDGTLYAIE
tara:strand:- start:55248 stop:57572 length:2325 start_codon:yes stop_codon:yes gene_type:complete